MGKNYCNECINYCNTSKELNLIEFSLNNSIKIGTQLSKKNNNTLLFAPAGNYPNNPIVTVCGLATSYQALQEIIDRQKDKYDLAQACLESVYSGKMAVNLALMLKTLNIHDYFDDEIIINIDNQIKSLNELKINSFGKSGFFIKVPNKLHLTQSTCCWNENKKSKFNKKWWDYSKDCRHNGYLFNLIIRFINSEDSKVFILLGSNNKNYKSIEKIVEELQVEKEVLLLTKNPKIGNPEIDLNIIKKIICFIHHPANTGFVYNNYKKQKSILYRFFENDKWDFPVEKYGNVSRQKMNEIKVYYESLAKKINIIKRNGR